MAASLLLLGGLGLLLHGKELGKGITRPTGGRSDPDEPVEPREPAPPPLEPKLEVEYAIDGYGDRVWQYSYSVGQREAMRYDEVYIIGNGAGTAFVTTNNEQGRRNITIADGSIISDVQYWSKQVAIDRLDAAYAATTAEPSPTAPQQPPQGPQGGLGGYGTGFGRGVSKTPQFGGGMSG